MQHHRSLFLRLASLLALCGSNVLAGAACAQQTGAVAPEEGGQAQLEQIVITAQKRSENLEKAPLAVTALTGDSLTQLGVSNATDLTRVVPDLVVVRTGVSAQVSMRGVVSTNDTASGDPAVAFSVDGVYLARSRAALIAFYDVDRVEVLRGPQGTLYGRNATVGTINVITNKPDLDKQAAAGSVEVGNYGELQTFGMLNLPISSTLGLRLAYLSDRHSGYSDNAPAPDYNDLDVIAGRTELMWHLRDVSTLLTVDYYHNGGSGDGGFAALAPLGIYARDVGATPYRYPISTQTPFNNERAMSTTLNVDGKLPLGTLTYLGNYRTDHWESNEGATVEGPSGAFCKTLAGPCNSNPANQREYQLSHELRLANDGELVKWVAGLYFFKERFNEWNALVPFFNPAFGELAFVQPNTFSVSRAAFGQATLRLDERLRLTGGLRYTRDAKGDDGYNQAFGTIVGYSCVGCQVIGRNYASLRWSKLNWKGSVDFDVTANSMAYATVSTGYKAGGYGNGTPPNNNPYNPETIVNYELGWKSDVFDHRLQANLAIFHDLYSGYQTTGAAIVFGQQEALTLNAGKATINGVEFETAALLTPLDRLNLNATYLHAYFTDFTLPLGDPFNAASTSYNGNDLPNAPRYTVRLGYQHTFALGGGATLLPRVDGNYTSAQYLDFHNYPVSRQGGYGRTDLSLTFDSGKAWRVMAYLRNVENKAILATAVPDSGAGDGTAQFTHNAGQGTYQPPRTFGVKLSASF